uniref:Endonuclease/exonuclease/phosphatase domain-containing protein n=1 Tax=Oncorhynchus mykiss TaxID=8022 RepID=A0A8C7NFP9_ONCMY
AFEERCVTMLRRWLLSMCSWFEPRYGPRSGTESCHLRSFLAFLWPDVDYMTVIMYLYDCVYGYPSYAMLIWSIPGSDRSYFTAILLRKSRVQLLESSIVNYPTTEMRRNLLMLHVQISSYDSVSFLAHPLCVMTSHMESMKPQSLELQNQVGTVWKTMREQVQDQSVIFGGDTNLKDWEVRQGERQTRAVHLGQPEDCRYTWDCVTNDKNDLPFPAHLRFDHIFLRQASEGSKVSPDGMTLVGLKRLDDCHWGLLCTFVIKPLSQATPE